MSISKIVRLKEGREPGTPQVRRHTGWQARVRVYETLPNGLPGERLIQISQNFLFEHGFNKEHAKSWEKEQLDNRDKIEQARRTGRRLPAAAMRRTIEELVDYYQDHLDFARLEPKSRKRISGILRDFLAWNAEHGRPYADLWTPDLAGQRLKHIWANYTGKGRQLRAGYEKKIFALELSREDRSIDQNPFPAIRQEKVKRNLVRPRAFTDEELRCFEELAEPYEWHIWNLFANTGLRLQEMDSLRVSNISFLGGLPDEIIIETMTGVSHDGSDWSFRVKNNRDRAVPLNPDARKSITYLLAHKDGSGFLIKRSFSGRSHAYLRALQNLKKRVIAKYPHLTEALSGDTPRTRTTVHTFRKTFVTNMLRETNNVPTVADLVGDDHDTVLNYYAAVTDADKRAAVNSISRSSRSIEHSIETLIRDFGRDAVLRQVRQDHAEYVHQ